MVRRTIYQKKLLEKSFTSVKDLEGRGLLKEAIGFLEKVIPQCPSDPELYFRLGDLCFKNCKFDKSDLYFNRAQHLDPGNDMIRFNLSTLSRMKEDYKSSIKILENILPRFKGNLKVLLELATLYYKCKEYQKSLDLLEETLESFPGNSSVSYLMGFIYFELNELEKSEAFLEKSISQIIIQKSMNNIPGYVEETNLFVLYLMVLKKEGKIEKFEKNFQLFETFSFGSRSFKISLINHFLNYNMLRDGFYYYQFRKSKESRLLNSISEKPCILDADLNGLHINLLGEQGIGDEIFFTRYLPELQKRGAKVSLFLTPKWLSISKRSFPEMEAYPRDDLKNVRSDLSLMLGDLPYSLQNFKMKGPVPLKSDEAWIDKVSKQLKSFGPPPYIGLTWKSGKIEGDIFLKNFPLKFYIEGLKHFKGTLVLLQRFLTPEDAGIIKEAYSGSLMDASQYSENLEAMMAMMHLIDDYISVSNTNLFLRPPGKKMKVVKTDFNDWRLEGDVWFPDIQVYALDSDKNQTVIGMKILDDIYKEYPNAF
jgi:tetratricopeptide (TPR) repeat protein